MGRPRDLGSQGPGPGAGEGGGGEVKSFIAHHICSFLATAAYRWHGQVVINYLRSSLFEVNFDTERRNHCAASR